jgi:C4-dicarboxylate-specific signal transduction histidine kinase
MAFNPEELELIALIEESLYLVKSPLQGKENKIINNASHKRLLIKGDRRQLEQVFINIS